MILPFTIVAVLLFAFLIWREHHFDDERSSFAEERKAFAAEREVWRSERRDLNNRIQVPEAAPFIPEENAGPQEDDLPIIPDIADPDELERVMRELAEVGYEEGPAL